MPTRDERKAAAKQNLALMRGAFANETKATIGGAVIYEDGEARALEVPQAEDGAQTSTRVTSDFTIKVVHRTKGKTAVVDPCSFTRPGGAYEDGSFGPEQILCSESNLYPVLQGMKAAYHDGNRGYSSGQLFTDRAMYLPAVTFVRDGDISHADVIAIPEPNRQRALENHRSEAEASVALANRIESILRIAADQGVETLIIGAFGCGPLGFEADVVIDLFKAWFAAHPGAIANVVFAVPRASFDAFDEAFGEEVEVEIAPPLEDAGAAEDEDDYDFDPDDLPEGVTFRS